MGCSNYSVLEEIGLGSLMITCMVPAYNEEANIKDTIESILNASREAKQNVEILVVVDGCTDRTLDIVIGLKQSVPQLTVIENEVNLGMGRSFRKTLSVAKGDRFLIVPGDNDMALELLINLFRNADKAEVVMAYFLNREIRGIRRNIISNIFASIYMITFRIFVQYINGPCVYPTKKLKELDLKSNRFSIVVEATIKLLKSGCSYYEVAGYMQKGLAGSSSLRFKNLVEVIVSYVRLLYEVRWDKREKFSQGPHRVYDSSI